MKDRLQASKLQIKIIFTVIALIIIVSVIIFTQLLVNELILREQKTIQFYTKIHQKYFESFADENSNIEDYLFLFDEITPTISFPIISTDENDAPNYPFEQYTLNVTVDTSKTIQQQREFLKNYVKKMGETYPPIIIRNPDGKILNKFYYTHSEAIDRLRLFPLVSIVIVGFFVVLGYLAFSNIRKNEESKVWVGMAKEAAHQLGTPISSITAWIEILKNTRDNPELIDDTLLEMEKDVTRLNVVATRFSKIGSLPERRQQSLSGLLAKVCDYYEKRVPHLGKKIEISRDFDSDVSAPINANLFEWVIENLIKNAAESIETKEGKIFVSLRSVSGKKAIIYVKDTGKGISSKIKRQIFSPGFTTKKRGWGLGLSLSKRIVEFYHNGKIYIKDTAPNKGTTFAIELPLFDT